MSSIVDNYIYYNNRFTDFCDMEEIPHNNKKLYSMDHNDKLNLDTIPGVLKLSSKRFNTTSKRGFIMKEFEPAFGYFPPFLVKTNKILDTIDKYVIVKIIHNVNKNDNNNMTLMGHVERYIGDVGNIEIEKELCKIIGTYHWNRKIDKINKPISDHSLLEIGIDNKHDLTPDRINFDHNDNQMNNMITISVDPYGATDIDDAISIEMINNDHYQIGIHIADPTSYLIEDSILDKEVSKRCESVYLSDQTFYMFPEYLSTKLFSLLSFSNKNNSACRAFSVILDINNEIIDEKKEDDDIIITDKITWKIIKKNIAKTLININENMTYQEFQNNYNENNLLSKMYEIGKHLYHTLLDPKKIMIYDSKKMIEIFMIIANCTVAEKMVEIQKYHRIHQSQKIIIRSQYGMKTLSNEYIDNTCNYENKDANSNIDVNNLMNDHIKLKLKAAEIKFYSNNINPNYDMNRHCSLNVNLYTHFTSPIRRYSDILVHRMLYNFITNTNTFTLKSLDQLYQIFLMNHYKKYYRHIIQLENDIKITNHIIKTIGKYPGDRIIYMKGIIMDIDINKKIKVKCIEFIDIHETKEDVDLIGMHFKNTIHTIHLVPPFQEENIVQNMECIKLFDHINFKLCFLNRDIRKIRAYL